MCDILACDERLKIIRHRAGFSYQERDCRFCGRLYPPYSSSNGALKTHLKKCGGIWEVPTDEPDRKRKELRPVITVNKPGELKVQAIKSQVKAAAATEEPVPGRTFIQGLVTPLNNDPLHLETGKPDIDIIVNGIAEAPAPRIDEIKLRDENTVLKKKLNEAINENYSLNFKLSRTQNENEWLNERNTDLLKEKEALERKVSKLLNKVDQKIIDENSKLKEQLKQLNKDSIPARSERKKLNRFNRTPIVDVTNSQDEENLDESEREESSYRVLYSVHRTD